MSYVPYYNASAPFWDWVASMEGQGIPHAATAAHQNGGEASDGDNNNSNNNNSRPNPWAEGWAAGFPFGGPFAHRPRHPYHHHRHHNGPPHPDHHEESVPNPAGGDSSDPEAGPSQPRGPPPPPTAVNDEEGGRPGHDRGRHGHDGPGGRGRARMHGRRGGWGGRGRGHFHPYAFGQFGPLAQLFQEQLFGGDEGRETSKSEDFQPEVDVFDTAEAFVVHVSVPGAKKEDVGVNWDAERSELSIAGVVHRPGDEEFLKTLALDERKVGAFERKVRLGSRANPAQVDVDAITARMEDGVLRVEVPKLDSGYVEIKKVDIE